MSHSTDELTLISNTIRALAIDGIQKANSGHPGMPMGCADIATVLWTKFLKHNPDDSQWKNRDRFILSAGHGSMLLYSMLHLSGYKISIDDIKNFRQFGSNTPGHPEHYETHGVETTTGPLGQGFANGVGMALAEATMANEFNKEGKVIDHFTYAIVSDGDLMEGISSEAASLAGNMGLGKIIYIYDSNDISIEGNTNIAFNEDIEKRFEAVNWHVQKIDGHNFEEIEKAILIAQAETTKPSIIIAKTKIGKGSPNKEGNESTHGAALGDEEIYKTKQNLGLDPEKTFYVPEEVYTIFKNRDKELKNEYNQWNTNFDNLVNSELKIKWDNFFSEVDIKKVRTNLPTYNTGDSVATRSAGGKVLETIFKTVDNFLGGSADLGPSNKTFVKGFSESGKNQIGRNIHYGIREHAMGAIQNGIAYYGGLISFSATFFVFMDYLRPAIRIAALGGLQSIYVFTHDSFFVGEDGPTHQPVEHLAAARTIPNLTVLRPADAEETGEAWIAALENTTGPTMLALSRQNLPVLKKATNVSNVSKGAYIIQDCDKDIDIILMASGSEVSLIVEVANELEKEGKNVRVVSFPSWELFEKQSKEYKQSVLPHKVKKCVVEAGLKMGWEKYAGNHGLYITMNNYGSSAPAEKLAEKFGFTKENILTKVNEFLG